MKRTVRQAEVSKQEADTNIDRKLNILNGWIANGIPYRESADGDIMLDSHDRKRLDFYPTSLRQFKAWDATQNCETVRLRLPAITATGNDTLAKRPAKQDLARRLIEALQRRAQTQTAQTSASEVKRLQAELKVARAIVGIREAELLEQQRSIRRIGRELAHLRAERDGHANEFKRLYDELTTELAEQKRENAILVAKLAKLKPLRAAARDRDDG
ncbi:hypothetical protein PQR46_20425 [Paraburkholderia sediminicola]|uniref:hypothetical protein n=1 Tax=Paraburkholderia sediminicola TaxID=458836 RepID=UPI0038B97FE3